jgi:hypothetical protein
MGYYDEPESYDATVSFTCSSEECGHENNDIEVAVFSLSDEDVDVDCEKCSGSTRVSISRGSCCYQEHCRC